MMSHNLKIGDTAIRTVAYNKPGNRIFKATVVKIAKVTQAWVYLERGEKFSSADGSFPLREFWPKKNGSRQFIICLVANSSDSRELYAEQLAKKAAHRTFLSFPGDADLELS